MMTDLQRAKELLGEPLITCAFVNNEHIITSKERGVKPLLEQIEIGLHGFSAADRVVGRAAALLYVLLGIDALYAKVISKSALEVLSQFSISCEFETVAVQIRNRRGDGPCPMEEATKGISDPEEGLAAIRKKLKEL